MRRCWVLGLCLAGCAAAPNVSEIIEPVSLFADPPTFASAPKLGTITVRAADTVITRHLVDQSVGAIDASAWFLLQDGLPTLIMTGFDAEDAVLRGDKSIRIVATFPTVGVGASETAVLRAIGDGGVTVIGETDDAFTVFITSLTATDQETFATMTGTFSGGFCAFADVSDVGCVHLTGSFDTRVQVQN